MRCARLLALQFWRNRLRRTDVLQITNPFKSGSLASAGQLLLINRVPQTMFDIVGWLDAASTRYGRSVGPSAGELLSADAALAGNPASDLYLVMDGSRRPAIGQVANGVYPCIADVVTNLQFGDLTVTDFATAGPDGAVQACFAARANSTGTATFLLYVMNVDNVLQQSLPNATWDTLAELTSTNMLGPFSRNRELQMGSLGDAQSYSALSSMGLVPPSVSASNNAACRLSSPSAGLGRGDDPHSGSLRATFPVADTMTWTLQYTPCVTFSAPLQQAYVDVVMPVYATLTLLLAVGVWVWSKRWQKRVDELNANIDLLKQMESASRDVVGYVCHELRNPLHVLAQWFVSLLQPSEQSTSAPQHNGKIIQPLADGKPCDDATDSNPSDALTASERTEIIADVKDAIFQMQSTVNDVLDFRKLNDGRFSYTPQAGDVHTALVATVRRGRTFVASGVDYCYSIPDVGCMVYMDRMRVMQILTNGVRCVTGTAHWIRAVRDGAFEPPGFPRRVFVAQGAMCCCWGPLWLCAGRFSCASFHALPMFPL